MDISLDYATKPQAPKLYCGYTQTGERVSLGTTNEDEAQQIIEANRFPLCRVHRLMLRLKNRQSGA